MIGSMAAVGVLARGKCQKVTASASAQHSSPSCCVFSAKMAEPPSAKSRSSLERPLPACPLIVIMIARHCLSRPPFGLSGSELKMHRDKVGNGTQDRLRLAPEPEGNPYPGLRMTIPMVLMVMVMMIISIMSNKSMDLTEYCFRNPNLPLRISPTRKQIVISQLHQHRTLGSGIVTPVYDPSQTPDTPASGLYRAAASTQFIEGAAHPGHNSVPRGGSAYQPQ